MATSVFTKELIEAVRATWNGLRVTAGHHGNPHAPEHLARRLAVGIRNVPEDGCWEWRGTRNNKGYGVLTLDNKRRLCHRIAYELANGITLTPALHVCHRCDNPACINPSHLFAGTRSDNHRDCFNKGRSAILRVALPRERHPSSKLNWDKAARIRELHQNGLSARAIAEKFQVSTAQVYKVVLGQAWVVK